MSGLRSVLLLAVGVIAACPNNAVPASLIELGEASSCTIDEDCCAAFHQCSATYVAVDRSQAAEADDVGAAPNVGQGCVRCAPPQPLPVCVEGTCQLIALSPAAEFRFRLEPIGDSIVSCREPGTTTPGSTASDVVADCSTAYE